MTIECLEALLARAQEMLATATGLPRGPSREYALETIRQYVSDIAIAMDVVESTYKQAYKRTSA
jgi:hypothetical protein